MDETVPEPISSLRDAGNELALRKPSRRNGMHELRAGEVLVGRLDIRSLTSAAKAEAADGTWRFDRPRGLSQKRIRVLSADGATELATFTREGMGRRGAMDLDGHRYRLHAHGWWKPRWVWTEGDAELAELTTRHTFSDERGRVALTPAGQSSPHAALLALLGAHLALLSAREQSAAAG
ncbi:MAG: hypothetical protein QOG77_2100 [Solirubrobacteraceae bacterium]|nr:hypothetical protein [Solirubrobacteraceae bacterium]